MWTTVPYYHNKPLDKPCIALQLSHLTTKALHFIQCFLLGGGNNGYMRTMHIITLVAKPQVQQRLLMNNYIWLNLGKHTLQLG